MSRVHHTLDAYLRTLAANLSRADTPGRESAVTSFAEVQLMEAFVAMGLTPEQQTPVGPYFADFLFPRERLCIEVDGREFHVREKDLRRDRFFRERGIRTLRIPATDVFEDSYACVESVEKALQVARVRVAAEELRAAPAADIHRIAAKVLARHGLIPDQPLETSGDGRVPGEAAITAIVERTLQAFLRTRGDFDPSVFHAAVRRRIEELLLEAQAAELDRHEL